jgi:2-polyprenyl-3-methyl-5-hydroxy-6-metoxy-1,4-benzoquinol methylase
MLETGTVSKDTGDSAGRCPYCATGTLRRTHTGLFHRLNRNHGPFDFYECANCGSGVTFPLPSAESLNALYQTYSNGLPAENRAAMGDDDGELWHSSCVKRIAELGHFTELSRFSWIEAGAGAGEMARRMVVAFPNSSGLAIDRHARPADLPASVEWLEIDLNQPDFQERIGRKADVVYATAVWEHVSQPDVFAQSMVELLNVGGLLYLVCPNYASLARKVLDTRWPYFTPGEHLTMPSPRGSEICLRRSFAAANLTAAHIEARPLLLVYSLFYTANRLGLPFARLIPRALRVPMPAGALESVAIVAADANTRR